MVLPRVVVLALCLLTVVTPLRAEGPVAAFVEKELPAALSLYKHFHTHPELSHKEFETAKRLAAELEAAGCEVTTGVGSTGVVALVRNGDGPVVMVRGDMDALPVTEQTGLEYASKVEAKDRTGNPTGVMHACGHDVHTTLLVGVAKYFIATKPRWKGTLMLIGQPAEEVSGGASGMLKDGLFTKFPKPTYAIAPHVDAKLAAGKIGYRAGYALANVDSVDVTLFGKGGHGAYPQGAIDPIVMAARFVLDLQTIISRENAPLDPAVITVGAIHAGTKHNIISDRCHLQITVRSYKPEVREKLLKAIERKAKATADSAGAVPPKVEFSDYTPTLKNDEALVERLVPVFSGAIGGDNVQPADQSLGGEDFSEFGLAGVPVFQFRLGSVAADRLKKFKEAGEEPPSLHSPFYYPDPEVTLRTGLTAMIAACEDLFGAK